MENCIEIKNLSKSFHEIHAVQNISFTVRKGELFAFLGENGAGKSTTISMICHLLEKDEGSISVCGKSIENPDVLHKIGVVFQESALDDYLSVYDNLKSRASLYGIYGKEFKKRLKELSTLLEFESYIKRPLNKLSGGQRRRIDLARALFHKPELLILDEPTTGLDPYTRKKIWESIEHLQKEEGLTVFLTTHYMEEASNADYVVIIDQGKIKEEGTPYELKNKYVKDNLILYHVNSKEIESLHMDYKEVNNGYKFEIDHPGVVTNLILSHPTLFKDYEVIKGNMDDVFLAVTGKKLGE